MTDWQPIETAPRDGTVIEVIAIDTGDIPRRWLQPRRTFWGCAPRAALYDPLTGEQFARAGVAEGWLNATDRHYRTPRPELWRPCDEVGQ